MLQMKPAENSHKMMVRLSNTFLMKTVVYMGRKKIPKTSRVGKSCQEFYTADFPGTIIVECVIFFFGKPGMQRFN